MLAAALREALGGRPTCLIRGPLANDSFGTQCRQSRCARPPITIKSPETGRNVCVCPPGVGRIKNRLLAPSVSTGTMLFAWTLPIILPR